MAISVPHVGLLEDCWTGNDREKIADILEEWSSGRLPEKEG